MRCGDFEAAIVEAARGASSPETERHLEGCPRCRERLRIEAQLTAGLRDLQLERALERPDPSVRAALAVAVQKRRSRLVPWVWAAAAAVLLALAGALTPSPEPAPPSPVRASNPFVLLDYSRPITSADTGRMVRRVPGELGWLIEDTLSQRTPPDDPVAHAIALFRDRDGARQGRRSAIVALAGVLEERRKLLKDRLLTEDEKALFEIANRYDIRHRNAKQHRDYGLDFLEWIFYWYLATVQLSDRLLDDSTR